MLFSAFLYLWNVIVKKKINEQFKTGLINSFILLLYGRLNPVEISINWSKIIETLSSYKKYKFTFIIESLLFSTNLHSNTDITFITCGGLTEGKTGLIDSKLHKTLDLVYLSEIKDWDLIQNDSKRTQTVFVDSEYHLKPCHFAFAFTTKSVSDLFNFTITLLDGSGNAITFPSNKTKVPILSLNIQIVKWWAKTALNVLKSK